MIQKPRGTKDIYGDDQKIYSQIFNSFEILAKSYNFQMITTPIFESLELFKNTVGETSDILIKEVYSFLDFSNRELALRPEGTAPIARAIIENKLMLKQKFNKLFYMGPMFRYERPQKGRMRQFYQIGVESVGNNSIFSIIEVIKMANDFLYRLDINDFILKINNIGTRNERKRYQQELTNYFKVNQKELSEMSISRIHINPMRILDDKLDAKKEVVLNAPKIDNFLSLTSKQKFLNLLVSLKESGISYEVDLSLVRGLDYYTDVVFEFESNSKTLGTRSTIIGGGCYENLIANSKENILGLGFGIGVERIFLILKSKNLLFNDELDIYFIINNEWEFKNLFPLISELRNKNISVDFNKKFTNPQKLFANSLSFKPKQIIYYDLFKNPTNKLITIKNVAKNVKIEVEINQAIKIILRGILNGKKNK